MKGPVFRFRLGPHEHRTGPAVRKYNPSRYWGDGDVGVSRSITQPTLGENTDKHGLAVLDLSDNNLSGKIPTSTQLQSFDASFYAGNGGLCGPPLASCPEDSLWPSSDDTNPNDEKHEEIFSFVQEVCISMAFGFILGFWGVVASFVVKKSWRIAYFNLLDAAGDWFYVRADVFLSKRRPT